MLYQIEMYNKWLGDAGQSLFPAISSTDTLKEFGILNCVSVQQAVDMIAAYVEATGIERYYSWTVTAWLRGRNA